MSPKEAELEGYCRNLENRIVNLENALLRLVENCNLQADAMSRLVKIVNRLETRVA